MRFKFGCTVVPFAKMSERTCWYVAPTYVKLIKTKLSDTNKLPVNNFYPKRLIVSWIFKDMFLDYFQKCEYKLKYKHTNTTYIGSDVFSKRKWFFF